MEFIIPICLHKCCNCGKLKQNQSSAYHVQSQGALERFHQTLKSLLSAYCTELDGDWEEGLSWLMLAVREAVQESTGFSPNDLVFGHTVPGPLVVLKDSCVDTDPPKNLVNFVNGVTTLHALSPSDISRVVSSIATTWAVRVWLLVTLSWGSVAGLLSSQ